MHVYVCTAVATLSVTLGVQVNMRLSYTVFDTTSLLTHMYLQVHACKPFKDNDTVVEPYAENLELLYLLSTNARV